MVLMEEEKAPENLSQKISTLSLTGAHKKVVVWVLYLFLETKKKPHESISAYLIVITCELSLSAMHLEHKIIFINIHTI